MNRINQQIEFIKEIDKTPESLFANALDRLMPLIHNLNTFGRAWKENGITKDQVLDRNKNIAHGSQKLWEFAKHQILQAYEKGMFNSEVEPAVSVDNQDWTALPS